MSPALPTLATSCKQWLLMLLRRARQRPRAGTTRLRLPVTAVLLPLAILFAAISRTLPPGYGRLALPLVILAIASLLAELVIVAPWKRPIVVPDEDHADPIGEKPLPIGDPPAAMPTVTEERYRAFFDHAEDSLCDIEIGPDGRFICLDINS